ncbi:MAG: copper homeostasis protein CutC [Bacteroidales bacterium]|jgi:copper homeostasis protein|nr:copper homeostasis protein CutC [Bacteroidales bacterium]
MKNPFVVEVCCANLDSVCAANEAHANRIELCSSLIEGGLTPSYGVIAKAKEIFSGDVMVMIRPRGGDFCYCDEDFQAMKADIAYCQQVGVRGVVFGILLSDGNVDKERTVELVQAAKGLQTCFHRAIDMSKDIFRAMDDVIWCGCDRILTSGGNQKAIDSLETLKLIQAKASKTIEIMVGSGINSNNVAEIYHKTAITQYHLSAKQTKHSSMLFRNNDVSMGGVATISEYDYAVSNQKEIIAVRNGLNNLTL